MVPLVTPNCLSWLIAVWISADLPLMSVKPWSAPEPSVVPVSVAVRVRYSAICQRGTLAVGS